MSILAFLALTSQSPEGVYLPFSPQETLNIDFIASWGDGDTGTAGLAVVVKEGYVYLAIGEGGLVVLDSRHPEDSVFEVCRIDSTAFVGLAIKDTFLFARTAGPKFDVYNISKPDSPLFVARETLYTYQESACFLKVILTACYIYIYNNLAYLTLNNWENPIYIVNISDPTNPKKLSEWRPTWNSGIYQVAFYPPKYLYCSSNRGVGGYNVLYILDVSDPANPVVADSMASWFGVSMAIETYDHYLYCGASSASVWDISDPLNPVLTDTYPFYDRAEDYFLNPVNKRLYAVNHLHVFDISDPSRLRRVGEWHDTEYWCFSVFYDRGYIYTAGRGALDHSVDLYILHYKYDTIIPPDTGDTSDRYLDWMRTVYGPPGLEFSLNKEGMVSFSLFNVAGLKACDKDLGLLEPGPHQIALPGLKPGAYFLVLKANEEKLYKSVIFTKP